VVSVYQNRAMHLPVRRVGVLSLSFRQQRTGILMANRLQLRESRRCRYDGRYREIELTLNGTTIHKPGFVPFILPANKARRVVEVVNTILAEDDDVITMVREEPRPPATKAEPPWRARDYYGKKIA
jgi:hypothetical protein